MDLQFDIQENRISVTAMMKWNWDRNLGKLPARIELNINLFIVTRPTPDENVSSHPILKGGREHRAHGISTLGGLR